MRVGGRADAGALGCRRARLGVGARCRVAASRLEPALDNEIVGDGRAAYTLAVTRHDGGRFIEHVILAHRDGHSTHDTDVEALG